MATDREQTTRPAPLFRRVDVGDGAVMFVPEPSPPDSQERIAWTLRYGDADSVRHQTATLMESFEWLLAPEVPMHLATKRLKMMRAAYRIAP